MRAEAGGWWVGPVLPAGTDYAYSLDGTAALPDPRSPWQPHGVHAASRTFDATAFAWPDGWSGIEARGAVHYELHVGTFTPGGTLDSAVAHLDHLADLGVGIVELMPLAAFDGDRGWGYDGVALYAVHEAYGGPAALQRFVAAAHERGLGVCLDVVYNHLGPSGNYLGRFAPYFSARHETPWGEAVNLDGPDSAPVREFLIDNALRWFSEFGLDELRLDAVHALADDSDVHLLAELSQRTEALAAELGRPLSLVAESDLNQARLVLPREEGGYGLTAQWADDVHHAVHTLLTGERHGYYVDFGSPAVLAKALTGVFVHDGCYATFRGRDWGAPVPDGVGGHAFVVSVQNHDQVGNRAIGDRPSRVLDDGQLAIAAAMLLCSPFTPMLFMGEEWGTRTPFQYFTDFSDPQLGQAVMRGRSEEFARGSEDLYGGPVEVPDPQARSTFEASTLDWSEPGLPERARLLRFYSDLIRLRRCVPDLASDVRARTALHFGTDPSWCVLHRGEVAVVVNLAGHDQQVPLAGAGTRPVLLAWEPVEARDDGLAMPAHGVAVLGAS
jgi:maltooligosyltrehalose trehalohydrolase